jgi:hypothetical protein
VAQVQSGIEGIVRLGLELKALQDEFHGIGHGGDRKSETARENQASARGRLIGKGSEEDRQGIHPAELARGWQARVREEIGISHQAALRIMEKALYVKMISSVSAGRTVAYIDSRRKEQVLEPTEEHIALAKDAMTEVVTGSATPQRAWAGIAGEAARRVTGRTAEKAEIDHYKNIKDGLIKLRTSLRKWRHLEPGQRAELETLWADVQRHLPDTWTM